MSCCGSRRGPVQTWTVTYPDGRTETKRSEAAAKLATSRVPGATYAKTPAPTTSA